MSLEKFDFEIGFVQRENKREAIEKEKKEKEEYDNKLVGFTEELVNRKEINKGVLLAGLKGIDSEEAWQLRDQLIASDNIEDFHIIKSIENLDSDKAWELRNKLAERAVLEEDSVLMNDILTYMNGLDSEAAWELRDRVAKDGNKANRNYSYMPLFHYSLRNVAFSLNGLDNERSWKMRDYIVENGYTGSIMLGGLDGLESDEAWELRAKNSSSHYEIDRQIRGINSEEAWAQREKTGIPNCIRSISEIDNERANRVREENLDKDIVGVASSLYGCKSARSFELRNKIIERANKTSDAVDRQLAISRILDSLGGNDSDEAWEMRDRILEEYKYQLKDNSSGLLMGLVEGLNGCDSDKAWALREKIIPIIKEAFEDEVSVNYEIIKMCENCNSDKAWELRKEILKTGSHIGMANLAFEKSTLLKNSEIKK